MRQDPICEGLTSTPSLTKLPSASFSQSEELTLLFFQIDRCDELGGGEGAHPKIKAKKQIYKGKNLLS